MIALTRSSTTTVVNDRHTVASPVNHDYKDNSAASKVRHDNLLHQVIIWSLFDEIAKWCYRIQKSTSSFGAGSVGISPRSMACMCSRARSSLRWALARPLKSMKQ